MFQTLLVADQLHPEPHLSEGSLFFSSSAKPKITYVENKTAMELEDQITLTCEASGDPIPSITWRTSTRNISNEEKVQPFPKPRGVGGLSTACPCLSLAWNCMRMHVEILLLPLHGGHVQGRGSQHARSSATRALS